MFLSARVLKDVRVLVTVSVSAHKCVLMGVCVCVCHLKQRVHLSRTKVLQNVRD